MSDSLCHIQLVVDRLLSGDLHRLSERCHDSSFYGAAEKSFPPVNLGHEATRLAELGAQLENEYKSGVTHRLEELENLQRSLANLFWHAQLQIEAKGADGSRSSMKLTEIVEKLRNIKTWVEKTEDLMKDEQSTTPVSCSNGMSSEEISSADA